MHAQSFCRKFVWHRECLWPEELPNAAMLVLAAEDDLVPSALVRAMLAKMNHPCEVLPLFWVLHACAAALFHFARCKAASVQQAYCRT